MAKTVPPPGGEDSLEEAMRAALAERGQAMPPAAMAATPPANMAAMPPATMPAMPPGTMPAEDPLAAAFRPPASADQYQFTVPRGLPRDAALESKARQWFHDAGLPQGLVNGILREYCRGLTAAPATDLQAGTEESRTLADLTREWGPDSARRIELARSVVGRCRDAEGVADLLAESGLGNNPWLIRSLAAFADLPAASPAMPGGDHE